jgi:hypothetical protein
MVTNRLSPSFSTQLDSRLDVKAPAYNWSLRTARAEAPPGLRVWVARHERLHPLTDQAGDRVFSSYYSNNRGDEALGALPS